MSSKKQGTIDRFFNSSTTGKKTSKEHEKTEKDVSEDEETSFSRNTCDDSVSPCSVVQRNEVDAEPKALTHSKVDTQISDKCIQCVPGPKAKRKRVLNAYRTPPYWSVFATGVECHQLVFPRAQRQELAQFKNPSAWRNFHLSRNLLNSCSWIQLQSTIPTIHTFWLWSAAYSTPSCTRTFAHYNQFWQAKVQERYSFLHCCISSFWCAHG